MQLKFQQVQPAVSLKLGKTTSYVTNQPDFQAKIHFSSNISNMRCSVSSGDETLCRMFDISSQTKSFLKEKLRMQILSSVSSDFQTLIKH